MHHRSENKRSKTFVWQVAILMCWDSSALQWLAKHFLLHTHKLFADKNYMEWRQVTKSAFKQLVINTIGIGSNNRKPAGSVVSDTSVWEASKRSWYISTLVSYLPSALQSRNMQSTTFWARRQVGGKETFAISSNWPNFTNITEKKKSET